MMQCSKESSVKDPRRSRVLRFNHQLEYHLQRSVSKDISEENVPCVTGEEQLKRSLRRP